jgi:aerobic-type carbon monoxide dehydrogenase small subunit (CoxS/CutS family)
MSETRAITLTVDGRLATVEARTTLVDLLREQFRLAGTHVGCEHGICGACTVLVDGDAVRGFPMLAVRDDGVRVATVEGLATPSISTRCRPSSSGITACNAASASAASSCR